MEIDEPTFNNDGRHYRGRGGRGGRGYSRGRRGHQGSGPRNYHDNGSGFQGNNGHHANTNRTILTTSTVKAGERHVVRALIPLNYKNCQDTDSLDKTIVAISDFIVEKWVDGKDDVCTGITACVTEFTCNTYLYAVLICYLHQKYREISHVLVHHLNISLSRCITDGDWRGIKALLSLLAELVGLNVLVREDVVAVFVLISSVLSDGMSSQERKDVFIGCFLKALLSAGSILGNEAAIVGKYESIAEYVANGRGERRQSSQSSKMFTNGIDFEQPDSFDVLWQQFNNYRNNGWVNSMFNRLECVVISHNSTEAADKMLNFPVSQFSLYSPYAEYSLPSVQFQLFHPSIISDKGRVQITLPSIDSVERGYIYDIIQDIVDVFQSNINELIKFIDECLYFGNEDLLFYVLMDVLVSSIMRLPEATAKSIYYQTIVMELCRKYPKSIPPVLGKTFYTLFDNVHNMDMELQFRFSSWFSLHISNFDFKWNWKEWKPTLEQDETRLLPQTRLVMDALEKCVRLSFYERVTKSFPEGIDLLPWMPPQPQPDFPYVAEKGCSQSEVDLATRLLESMRQSTVDSHSLIKEIDSYFSANSAAGRDLSLKMVSCCVFQLGTKSFSHMLGAIEKHGDLIKSICVDEDSELSLIDICYGFWKDNMQFFMITVDKLVKSHVVDESSIVSWIFDNQTFKYDYWRSYRWDMLLNLVQNISNTIAQLTAQIERPPMDSHMPVPDLESKLETLKKKQKSLFIKIFEQFILAINNSAPDEMMQSVLFETMRMFGRRFHREVKALSNTLEMIVFANQPESITSIFSQLKNIHQ